jgi:hypothetical protein
MVFVSKPTQIGEFGIVQNAFVQDVLTQERDNLEVENTRLRALNREQTTSRVSTLKGIVRHRGVQLKGHGEFLIKMAHSGLLECREG